jgi:pimeloyl-ACP methyl ester carboxylesterase
VTVQTRGKGAILEAMLPRLVTQRTLDEQPGVVEKVKAIMDRTSVQGYAGDLMAMATRPDSVDMLASINVPSLVIVGEQDGLTPPADAQLMAERIPGAKLVVIPGAAHASNMEQPEAFTNAVREFLAGV